MAQGTCGLIAFDELRIYMSTQILEPLIMLALLPRNMNNHRIESCRSNDLVQLEYNSNDYCMFIRNINNPRIESCRSNDFLFNLNTIATTIVCLIVT